MCPIVGDAKLVLGPLIECVRERLGAAEPRIRTARRIAEIRGAWLKAWKPLLESEATPIDPYRVVAELSGLLAERESIVTHDSGSPRDQMTPFYTARRPRSYIGWGKSHALGTGLGLMMGAKVARPDAVCVHVMGDAAFGMVGLDFETAVRAQIPIVGVVLNNSTMAIETPMMPVAQEQFHGRDIGGDYAALVQAMGAWARRVHDPREVRGALEEAIRQTEDGMPAVVEVITSPVMSPFTCKKGQRSFVGPTS